MDIPCCSEVLDLRWNSGESVGFHQSFAPPCSVGSNFFCLGFLLRFSVSGHYSPFILNQQLGNKTC